jgi:hypothetical protein
MSTSGVPIDHLDLQVLLTQSFRGGKLQAFQHPKGKLALLTLKTNGQKAANSHLQQAMIVLAPNLGAASKLGQI